MKWHEFGIWVRTKSPCVAVETSLWGDHAVSPLSLSCQKQWHGKKKEWKEGLERRTPHTPANGRWGMNRGRGCGMPTSTAPLAAWVIPCLWPKKGTHSREQEVDGEGQRARGSSEQEIDYRGNHLYSSGAVAKRPNFPAKTTEYHLQKSSLRTEKVFDFKASRARERDRSPISNSGSSRPTKRLFSDAVNTETNLQLTTTTTNIAEERKGGEKCVVAGFQRRAKKGPPSDPRAKWSGGATR